MTLDSFLPILAEAAGGLARQAEFRSTLAGSDIRIRAEPRLLDALAASLHRREPLLAEGIDIVAWTNSPSPILRAPAEWRVAERWAQREPVRAVGAAGMVFFDPIGCVVTIYDAIRRWGGLWIEDAAALKPWIAAAPFLRLFDAWFTARGKFACHGAAIVRHGRAALIIGPGGAGKSTLALHAARNGFGYVGDDYVLLEPGPPAPVVHSMYSSGKLATADVATGAPSWLSVVREADDALDKVVLRVSPSTVTHAAPVGVVVSPRIVADRKASVEPISPAEALRILLPGALQQLPGDYQAKLDILRRAMTVPCVRLNLSGSHEHNLAAIDEMLAGVASPDIAA